jgi:pimeloyl-ACP methyl ester carboxylesterase
VVISSAEVRRYVLDEGTGHPVLFLHGLGGSWRDWEPQLDTFSADFRVVVPEHRGHGRSDRPLGRYSTALFARDVARLCHLLAIEHSYVVGLSMGGMVAQHLALESPGLVDALVIADTSARVDPAVRPLLLGAVPTIRQDGMGLVQELSRSMAEAADYGTRADLMRNNLREASGNDPYAYSNALIALVEHDLLEQLPSLRVPTLILRGEHDPLAGQEGIQELAKAIDSSESVTISDAGHLANIDQPEHFDQAVRGFLERHRCPRS